MDLTTIVIIILVLVVVGVFPAWPHSRSWGLLPAATALFVLILILVWSWVRG